MWGNLARDVTTNSAARRVIELLQDGDIVPFLTWHHLAELLHHANEETVAKRIKLLKKLPFVAFPRNAAPESYLGSILEVQEAEMAILLEEGGLDLPAVISKARPGITNGFGSGKDFCRDNEEWWHFYREHFSLDVQKNHAEIAAVTHFPTTDLNEKIPDSFEGCKIPSEEQARQHFAEMAEILALHLRNDVKKPLANPEAVAYELMRESHDDAKEAYSNGGNGDWLLKYNDIDRGRLPQNPTVGDAGDEAVFVKQLAVYERRKSLPQGSLKHQIRKEMLPSWIVKHDMNCAIRQLPKAEAGNVNDISIVSFGLYVDRIQFDKRIRHFVTELARKSALFALIKSRLIGTAGYSAVIVDLERMRSEHRSHQ